MKTILAKTLSTALCLLMAGPPLWAQPWNPNRHTQSSNLFDPEKHSRSRVNPLKSQDIKEHKGKVTAIRHLLFKDGGLPTKALLTTEKIDSESGAQSLDVQARFGDFSEKLKPQILSQLNLGGEKTLTPNSLITIKATVTGTNAVQVTKAKIDSSRRVVTNDFKPVVPVQTQNQLSVVPKPNRPTAPKPAQNLRELKNDQTQPSVVTQYKSPTQSQRRSDNPQLAQAVGPAAQNQPLRMTSVPSLTNTSQPELTIVARSLATTMGGNPRLVRLKAVEVKGSDELKAAAIIPLNNGKEVTVTRVQETTPGTFDVQFEARFNDLPKNIQQRIEPKIKTQTSDGNQPVQVVMTIQPDNTMTVASVKPIQAPVLQTTPVQNLAPPQPKTDTLVPPTKAASLPKTEVKNPLTSSTVLDGTLGPPSVGQAILNSPEAQSLQHVTSVLVDEFVPVQNLMKITKPDTSDNLVAAVPLRDNVTMSVYKVDENPATGDVTYRAEAQFQDLSSPIRKEILDVLSAYGGGAMVDKKTPVEIDVIQSTDESITLIAIKIKDTDTGKPGSQETVLLWGQPDDVKNDNRTKTIPLISQLKTTNPLSLAKTSRDGPKEGLLPVLSQAVQTAFNLKPDAFAAVFAPNFVKDEIMITHTKDDAPALHVQWKRGGHGEYQFFAEGRALDFSDKIREQIYQKLRDELTKGEKWAREALTGNKKLTVLLEAVLNPETQQVETNVKEIGISLETAATELALALGLMEGDYNLLIDQANGLITIQPGKVAQLKNVQLVSPNAPIHILVKRKNLSEKGLTSVYMSRVSLQDNVQALDAVMKDANGTGLATAQLAQNPDATHFHIQLPPQSASGGTILALNKKKKKQSQGRTSLENLFQP